MAVLFDKDETNIRKHINNVFRSLEVDKNNNTQKMRVDGVKQPVAFYSLDVILAVGYRVNSQRGIAFRKWANNVLNRDPETKLASTQKGQTKVSRFPLVVKRNRTNKAFVVMITACGNNAEFVEKYLV